MIVVATNERHHLVDLLPSLARQNYNPFEVLVVDNGSSDGGPELVEAQFPSFEVVRNGANLGYLKANNRGFKTARGDVLVVLNPDTEVEPDWLAELAAALDRHPDAGLATSRILMFDDRTLVNTCGNEIHLTGLTFCRGLGRPRSEYEEELPVGAVSGCSFAIRRSVLDQIGGFEEELNPYLEDTDLSWRARLAGNRIVYAPRSIVYHKYALRMRPQKFAYLEENRLVVLVKSVRWRTLVLLAPALLIAELMTWTYAVAKGRAYALAKLRSYGRLVRGWPRLLERRRQVQHLRRVPDRELMGQLTWRLPLDQVIGPGPWTGALAALANACFWVVLAASRRFAN